MPEMPVENSAKVQGLGEKIADHWLGIILVAGLIALLLAMVQACAETYLSPQRTATTEIVEAGEPGEGEPLVRVWIDRAPIQVEEPVTLRLRFQNPTPQAFRVQLEELHPTPFLRPLDHTWVEITGAWGGRKLGWRQATFDLDPGAEQTVWTQLIADAHAGAVTVTVVLSWSPIGPSGTGTSTRWVLPLDDVRIISSPRAFRAAWIKAFITLLGVLVLPTVGGLLAYGFQQRQQTLVQERQENQKRIDRERQERQRQIDHERQAWANMLPVSHENNVEYYIPLGTAIRTLGAFCQELRMAEKSRSPDRLERRKQTYFLFLYLLRRWRVIVDGGAGFYLKDREGEELVAGGFDQFFDQLFTYLTPEERAQQSLLVDLMDADDSYSSFGAKLEDPALAQETRDTHDDLCARVGEWLLSVEGNRALQWLTLAHRVLMFEVNRIYKFWYGSEPAFPSREISDLVEDIEKLELSQEERSLLDRLRAYRERIRQSSIERTEALEGFDCGAPRGFRL